jgi:hypothetical protein
LPLGIESPPWSSHLLGPGRSAREEPAGTSKAERGGADRGRTVKKVAHASGRAEMGKTRPVRVWLHGSTWRVVRGRQREEAASGVPDTTLKNSITPPGVVCLGVATRASTSSSVARARAATLRPSILFSLIDRSVWKCNSSKFAPPRPYAGPFSYVQDRETPRPDLHKNPIIPLESIMDLEVCAGLLRVLLSRHGAGHATCSPLQGTAALPSIPYSPNLVEGVFCEAQMQHLGYFDPI